MSHQTGATFAVLLFQTTELMNPFKQPRPAQAINNVVPTFQARERDARARTINQFVDSNESRRTKIPSRCQYSGMRQNKKPMKEKAENRPFG